MKVSIGQRMTRAFLIGLGIGIVAGLGFYFMTTAINMIAATTVFDPIAMLILTMGFILAIAIGIEMSKDISAIENTIQSTTSTSVFRMEASPEVAALLSQIAQGMKKTEDGPPTPA
jgi:flagellar motor component MotA